jgi:hypothetical protein
MTTTRYFNKLQYREIDHGLSKQEALYIARKYQTENPNGSYRLVETKHAGWKVYWRGTKS